MTNPSTHPLLEMWEIVLPTPLRIDAPAVNEDEDETFSCLLAHLGVNNEINEWRRALNRSS